MNADRHEDAPLDSRSSAGIYGATDSTYGPSVRTDSYPVFGICGYSGSGKTTLIETLIPHLRARGLKVGVIKQDAHGLQVDREGKDTDRIFKAGADVLIRDRNQTFARLHEPADADVHAVIARIGAYYDLILVEGHKRTVLPRKMWLCKPEDDTVPPEATGIDRTLAWNEDRPPVAIVLIDDWLREIWLETPVYAGILIGGASTRMGRPKHLIGTPGETWLGRAYTAVKDHVENVVVLGGGEIPDELCSLPVLPDAEHAEGPLRGMRAAMRWAPRVGWLFVACDQPGVSSAAVEWLLSHRRPGVRAVMPALPGASGPEPLLAYYDFRMASAVERVRRPRDLSHAPGVATPGVPGDIAPAWRNVNSPADLDENRTEGLDGVRVPGRR